MAIADFAWFDMKQLKSSLGDLRRLFARTITLRDIAEPLASFDLSQSAGEVRAFMGQREFDVVGVREHGVVTGYAIRSEETILHFQDWPV